MAFFIGDDMEVRDAYIYSRVSKESQAKEGEGLKRQIERAEKFIETENNINIGLTH